MVLEKEDQHSMQIMERVFKIRYPHNQSINTDFKQAFDQLNEQMKVVKDIQIQKRNMYRHDLPTLNIWII